MLVKRCFIDFIVNFEKGSVTNLYIFKNIEINSE